jgi:hypothetical protein
MKPIIAAVLAASLAALPIAAHADDDDDDLGAAGVLSSKNRADIPSLMLSAGMPLMESGDTITLKSGKYYELEIEADGSQELALFGADFFRAIWIDEIVIEGIEVRPMGINSMEFDEAGEAEISFLAIKPGTYALGVPGSELQSVTIVIE